MPFPDLFRSRFFRQSCIICSKPFVTKIKMTYVPYSKRYVYPNSMALRTLQSLGRLYTVTCAEKLLYMTVHVCYCYWGEPEQAPHLNYRYYKKIAVLMYVCVFVSVIRRSCGICVCAVQSTCTQNIICTCNNIFNSQAYIYTFSCCAKSFRKPLNSDFSSLYVF